LHPTGAGAPSMPAGVETAHVDFEPAAEPPRDELFVAGTAITHIEAKAPEKTHPAIVYPGRGEVIAVDPDIPRELQRVRFEAVGAGADAQWRLNGEAIVVEDALWRPRPGKWLLSLHDRAGQKLDEVSFEVRGGGY